MAANVKINGNTYNSTPYIDVPKADNSGDARFWDTSGADIASGDLPTGKTGYGANGAVQGSMPVNGDVSGVISTKAGTVVIPAGKTSGGTVSIDPSAVADLTSANLLSGKSALGIDGGLTVPTITQDSTTHALRIS